MPKALLFAQPTTAFLFIKWPRVFELLIAKSANSCYDVQFFFSFFKVYHLKTMTILTAGWGGIEWKRSTQLEEHKLIDSSLDASYSTVLVQWMLLLKKKNPWTKCQIINYFTIV